MVRLDKEWEKHKAKEMNEIPRQLQRENIRFIRLNKNSKKPKDVAWNKINSNTQYKFNNKILLDWLNENGNYGVICGSGLIVIDVDDDGEELEKYIEENLPKTFTVKSWSKENYKKHYYFWNSNISLTNLDMKENDKLLHYGEIRAKNINNNTLTQVVGPGCHIFDKEKRDKGKHYEGDYYVIRDLNIVSINDKQLDDLKKKFLSKEIIKSEKIKRDVIKFDDDNIENNLNIINLIDISKLKQHTSGCYMGSHPIHGSTSGTNFYVDIKNNRWNCFHPNHGGGGIVSWIAVKEGLIDCKDAGKLNKETYKKVVQLAKIKYGYKPPKYGTIEVNTNDSVSNGENKDKSSEEETKDYEHDDSLYRKIARQMHNKTPYWYDEAGLWWLWNNNDNSWDITDETQILITLDRQFRIFTEDSKTKGRILSALKKYGRSHKPKDMKKTWIQFNDKIVDIETMETFDASSEYFVVNRIPWSIGESCDTPTMDKLFEQWVGKKYIRTLYEVLAFSCLSYLPFQRFICLKGGGSNGKTQYFKVNNKFVGLKNASTTSLKKLLRNNFAATTLYKKLLTIVGEVSSINIKETDFLKNITDGGFVNIEFKGKNSFEEPIYSTILLSGNEIPTSSDNTDGWVRRWLIIEFPNQFKETGKEIYETIPDEEYNNLARKVPTILNEMFKQNGFTNEGTIQDRRNNYLEKSSTLANFIDGEIEDDSSSKLILTDFYNAYQRYCNNNDLKIESRTNVNKVLKSFGYDIEKINVKNEIGNYTTKKYVIGLKWI